MEMETGVGPRERGSQGQSGFVRAIRAGFGRRIWEWFASGPSPSSKPSPNTLGGLLVTDFLPWLFYTTIYITISPISPGERGRQRETFHTGEPASERRGNLILILILFKWNVQHGCWTKLFFLLLNRPFILFKIIKRLNSKYKGQ